VTLGILFLLFPLAPSLHAEQNFQSFLNELMRERKGAVIVSNPETGQLLAVWDAPAGFAAAFPPGSAAKLVASTAALEEGVISPWDRVLCRRVPELLGEAYHCSHPLAAAPFTVSSALANSCNYFFAQLSVRLSSLALAHWYAVFGFGTPDDSGEGRRNSGQIRVGDDPADKARAALGEGTVTATPAQVLLAYSAIATGGKVFRLEPSAGKRRSPSLLRTIRLQPTTFAVLRAGLEECVRSGTCQAAAVPGIRVAGKTGTASGLDGSGKTHAWFVGYAPAESAEVALVVFLDRGTGTRDAAPLAGQILNRYFAGKRRRR
jgi:cell division protein FtsI/penicillin-binding protein 2